MIYHLDDLLMRMGAPEVAEKGGVSWHYFDRKKNTLAGSASLRLEDGGERLVAELRQLHENYEDDDGKKHDLYTDAFHMTAERTARRGHYRITHLSFDGVIYENPTEAVISLALGVFHARALDISIRMVEQAFNKQDMLQPQESGKLAPRKTAPPANLPRQEGFGIVIPFRPRTAARLTA